MVVHMNLYLIFIIVLTLFGIKPHLQSFNNDYLNKTNTSCIKGIFILIVFYSHLVTYIGVQQSKDFLMFAVRDFLGQLMVTMFLFYSGYGIYESIKKKKNYVSTIPKKRILKTLINFDIAIIIFLIVNLIINKEYSIQKILLSFIGWESIGNDNWYIFSIILLYFITYISFKIFDKNDKSALKMTWLLTIIFILFLNLHKEIYWYNTLLCYPLGLTYSYYKEKIEKVLFNNKKYYIIFIISLFAFLIIKKSENINFWYYEISSLLFVFVILQITMKLNINNKVLNWFGDKLFWIFILHRIPMNILKEIGYINHAYRFALISFIITLILTFIMSKITSILENKLKN